MCLTVHRKATEAARRLWGRAEYLLVWKRVSRKKGGLVTPFRGARVRPGIVWANRKRRSRDFCPGEDIYTGIHFRFWRPSWNVREDFYIPALVHRDEFIAADSYLDDFPANGAAYELWYPPEAVAWAEAEADNGVYPALRIQADKWRRQYAAARRARAVLE